MSENKRRNGQTSERTSEGLIPEASMVNVISLPEVFLVGEPAMGGRDLGPPSTRGEPRAGDDTSGRRW